ncbi:MAG: radical SAM protein [Candidatus Omnitrophota bacterium]|nr:MAG: radical SAM protein [Candidatus Omnitrophota bacterium]
MTKEILLINPPLLDSRPNANFDYNTGLLKIGAFLKNQGCRVCFFDFLEGMYKYIGEDHPYKEPGRYVDKKRCGMGSKKIFKKRYHIGKPYSFFNTELKKIKKPDEIYVGSSLTFYWEGVHKVVEICKKLYPDIPVTIGGIYPTLAPEHAKRSKADNVIIGQFKGASDLPPAMELMKEREYKYAIIKTTRGCCNNCSYCAVPKVEGKIITHRPIGDVIAELQLRVSSGIRKIVFWESNILQDAKQYFEKLLDRIIELELDLSIQIPEGFDPRLIYPEIIRKLRLSGVSYIGLALESSDSNLQHRFHKKLKLSYFEKVVKLFKEEGYFCHKTMRYENDIWLFVLIGLPEQSLKSILLTLIDVWKLGCLPVVLPYTPIPGTEEYVNYRHLIKGRDLEELAPSLMPFANDELTVEDLEEIQNNFSKRHFTVKDIKNLPNNSRVTKVLKALI